MNLLESEWIFMNDIIYRVYNNSDLREMRMQFLETVRILIPYDMATFYLADHESDKVLRDPIGIGLSQEALQKYIDSYLEIDYAKWVFSSSQSKAYRTTDWFPYGNREVQPYYKMVYEPKKIHYAVLLPLIHNEEFNGIVCLYRRKESQDFSDKEIFILDMLKNHLSLRIFREEKEEKQKLADIIQESVSKLGAMYSLTDREQEIILKVLEGKTNQKIIEELIISENTLKKHLTNIYKKLDISQRNELLKVIEDLEAEKG